MAATITVVCPQCKNRMRASSEYVGRTGRCPACKSIVEIQPGEDSSLASTYPVSENSTPSAAIVQVGTTEVPGWQAGLIGIVATAILYLLVFLPAQHPFRRIVSGTGSHSLRHCTGDMLGLALLALKWIAVRRQQSYAELELELIPLEIGLQITPANVEQFGTSGTKLLRRNARVILGRCIQGALATLSFPQQRARSTGIPCHPG